jgi:hypothetical protein
MPKIEPSAGRVCQVLGDFEVQDQQYLLDLMHLIEQESSPGGIDPEGLLSDAKFQILAMIADHVTLAYREVSFLQILPYWFTEILNRQ